MRLKTHVWLVGITFAVMVALVWYLGSRQRMNAPAPGPDRAASAPQPRADDAAPVAPGSPRLQSMFAVAVTNAPNVANTNPFAYRLSNTAEPLNSLVRNETAVLLRHAFIDTALPGRPEIPPHLRSAGEPGSYVVQARGAITQEYRDWLQQAGAEIVSYVPNNSFLVRADAAVARRIEGSPGTQAVLPFEPYYKFDALLLPLAVRQEPSPYELLNVVAFPGQAAKVQAELEKMGGQVMREAERTLLGDIMPVKVPAMALADVARVPEVHILGVRFEKKLANDLSRVKLRVSRTSTNKPPNDPATTQYAAPKTNDYLTGQGILVGVNDTGVDDQHPDLAGRVIGPVANVDPDGHGTHVTGSLIGDGTASPLSSSNALGSFSNANFYGIAPKARAYVQDYAGPDTALQTNTALTNILISNNSWGYGVNDYDIFAASYDAAVRDSLPGATGEQEVAYVFAAGNEGGGGAAGLNGIPGSILSPATAKNVITVGATDQLRLISNAVYRCTSRTVVGTDTNGDPVTNVVITCETNMPWLGQTESDNQVSPYSSRGNVGIGIEDVFGRVKPDVVAPGSMVVSARSAQYEEPDGSTNNSVFRYNSISVAYNTTNLYALNIPASAVRVRITTVTNYLTPTNPLPPLLIGAAIDAIPSGFIGTNDVVLDTNSTPALQPGTLFYTIANNYYSNAPVVCDLIVVLTYTNNVGNYYEVLKKLNEPLKPYYRYESGTSQAAPKISGMLALIQEYLATNFSTRPSPALLKALIINGARSLSTSYNLDPHAVINHQGWGIANMSNTIPVALSPNNTNGPLRFFDQKLTNGLATGGTHTYQITVPAQARSYPLRFSVVWTDPPGNPISSIKLVNDMNLVVTGNVSSVIGGFTNTNSLVWVGNNFAPGSDFTSPIVASSSDPDAEVSTNLTADIAAVRDVVNNVENVFIAPPLASNYTVIVKAHRVNVNALNSHTNGIVQDYALVISSGNVSATNVNLGVTGPTYVNDPLPRLAALRRETNSYSSTLLNQRVGANSALITSTNGATNQWSFFMYTNVPDTNYRYVLIVTFLPPNLSLPRFREADIDLYVRRSTEMANVSVESRQFTNELDATQISLAQKSLSRGGTEFVVYTNSPPNEVFFIGVKSEDQQAASFGIMAVSSYQPFSDRQSNNIVAHALTLPMAIPDGTPDDPGGTSNLFAFVTEPGVTVRRAYVTNSIFHEQAGDTIGILTHRDLTDGSSASVALNNHRTWTGFETVVYDDSNEGDLDDPPGSAVPPVIPPDGPGTMRSFVGQEALGMWELAVSDNALFHTGYVDRLTVVIEPASTNENAVNAVVTILPNRWRYFPVNVPFDAFNMEVCVSDHRPPRPIAVFIKQGDFPYFGDYDHFFVADPPGECLDIGLGDNPPLVPGRWYIGLFNSNASPVTVTLRVTIQRKAIPGPYFRQSSTAPIDLIDDAVTNSTIVFTNRGRIADLRVGLRVDHERASDLVFHLISPQRTRLLLMENRGRTNGLGIGATLLNPIITTNYGAAVLDDGFERTSTPTPGNTNLTAGQSWSGWYVESGEVDVVNTNTWPDAHTGTNLLDLNGLAAGSISTNVATVPGTMYLLTFAYAKNGNPGYGDNPGFQPTADVQTNGQTITNIIYTGLNHYTNLLWSNGAVAFTATATNTKIGFVSTYPGIGGIVLDTIRLSAITLETNYYIYTTFTENTNLTITPIKFGRPPFTNSPPPVPVSVLDCNWDDQPVNTIFGAGSWVAGWYVESGEVDTFTDAPFSADTPPLLLDLGGETQNGTISTNLNLESGVDYTLSFAYKVQGNWTREADFELTGIGKWTIVATNWGPVWFRTNINFTATGAATTFRITSKPPGGSGLFIDTLKITRRTPLGSVQDAYFLPEELIKPFFGQQAYGPWTLEVWDSRMGGAVTGTPQLVSWKLEMTFAQTNPPLVRLTNGSTFSTNVAGGGAVYFSVDVPCSVGFATNTLICTNNPSSGVNLVFNQYVLPTNGPNDVLLLANVVGTNESVLTIGQPPLVFATRYYLAVTNANPTESNNFTLSVNFDCSLPYITLTNNLVYCTNVEPFGLDQYRYTMHPDTVQGTFEIVSMGGNADLYLRHRALAGITTNTYSYASTNLGVTNEFIVVRTNDAPPINDSSGGFDWFMAVTNLENFANGYCVRVSEIRAGNVQVVTLTNITPGGCDYLFAGNFSGTNFADYFIVDVPPGMDNLVVDVYANPVGDDVDLYVRDDYWPGTNSTPASVGTNSDTIVFSPPLASGGNYFITVMHTNPVGFVNYDLTISASASSCPDLRLKAGSSSYTSDGFLLKWSAAASQQFEVQFTDSLSPPNWQPAGEPVSSGNGQFEFLDTGAKTNATGQRFYRLLRVQ